MVELYGSFSDNPGNFGFSVHNRGFEHYSLNKMYLPFKVAEQSLQSAIDGIKALGIKGVGVSSPHKTKVIDYLDFVDELVKETQSCNTILNVQGKLLGYNTDYTSVSYVLGGALSGMNPTQTPLVVVCGNGGYAKTVMRVCAQDGWKVKTMTVSRQNWNDHEAHIGAQYTIVFNATPVIIEGPNVINASVDTEAGRKLAYLQAREQFALYTDKHLPDLIAQDLGIAL